MIDLPVGPRRARAKGPDRQSRAEIIGNDPQFPTIGKGPRGTASGGNPRKRQFFSRMCTGFTRERSLVRAQPCPSEVPRSLSVARSQFNDS
jgi:hypothetical protein